MRSLTVLLVAVLVAAAPAAARQMSPQDLERSTVFVQRMQAVYLEAIGLSTDMSGAADYIDSYYAGELDPAEFTEALNPFLDDMRAAVDDYRARYPRAPSPPSIGNPPYERSMASLAQMVVGLGGLLDRQLGVLHRLRDAAFADDADAYDRATADSLALATEMIRAENASLEGSLVAIQGGHPQRGLSMASIGGNKVMIVALGVVEANLRGEGFDAAKFALEAETGLRDAGRAIVEGERAGERMLKDLEGKVANTQADRQAARFIGALVESYRRAFVIERGFLEAERGLLDYLRAINDGSEDPETAMDAMAEFQSELADLTGRRLEEQNIRLEMIAEFSRGLQNGQN